MLITSPHHPFDLIQTTVAWQEHNYTFSYPEQLKLFFCCCWRRHSRAWFCKFLVHFFSLFLSLLSVHIFISPCFSSSSVTADIEVVQPQALCHLHRSSFSGTTTHSAGHGGEDTKGNHSTVFKLRCTLYITHLTFLYFYFLLFCIKGKLILLIF